MRRTFRFTIENDEVMVEMNEHTGKSHMNGMAPKYLGEEKAKHLSTALWCMFRGDWVQASFRLLELEDDLLDSPEAIQFFIEYIENRL